MKRQAGKDGSPSRSLTKRPRERDCSRRDEPPPPPPPAPLPPAPQPLALLLAESRGYHRRHSRSRERDKPRLREERGAAALELQQQQQQQQQHRAELSLLGRPPRPGTLEYKTLLISNLGAQVEDEHVEDALFHEFKKFGDVSVKLSHTPELGRVAYVNFRRPEDAREARRAKSSRLVLGERQLRVEPMYVRRRSATPPDVGYPPLQPPFSYRQRSLSPPGPNRDIRDLRELRARQCVLEGFGRDRERLLDYYGLLEERGRGLLLGERGRSLLDERGRSLLDLRGRDLLEERGRGLLLEDRGRSLIDERGRGLLGELQPEDDQRATSNLFIGGLPGGVTEAELRRDFQRFGAIEGVVIKRSVRAVAGTSGGGLLGAGGGGAYAFVKFRDLDMAHRAKVAMQGRLVGGNPVRIGYGKATPTTRLWVGGLGGGGEGGGASASALAALARELDRFGAIRSIRVVGGRGTRGGEEGGSAYVQFESLDAARAACAQMRGFPLGGTERRLRVDFAREEEGEEEEAAEPRPHSSLERESRGRARGERLSPPPTRRGRSRSRSQEEEEEPRLSHLLAPPTSTTSLSHYKSLARPRSSLEREFRALKRERSRSRSPSASPLDEERRRGRGYGAPPTTTSLSPYESVARPHCSLERESREARESRGRRRRRRRSSSPSPPGKERGGHDHRAPPPSSSSPPPSPSSSPRAPDSTTELHPDPSPSSSPAPPVGPASSLQEVWSGSFSLKNSSFPTRLLLLEGGASFLAAALPRGSGGASTQLKMAQRLRLDPPRLDEVARRVRAGRPHTFALLLALQGARPPRTPRPPPAPEEPLGSPQVRLLRHLVTYLRSKDAAGVVSLPPGKGAGPGSGGGATLYAFPPGAFPQQCLQEAQRTVGNLNEEHLVVVIVSDS